MGREAHSAEKARLKGCKHEAVGILSQPPAGESLTENEVTLQGTEAKDEMKRFLKTWRA